MVQNVAEQKYEIKEMIFPSDTAVFHWLYFCLWKQTMLPGWNHLSIYLSFPAHSCSGSRELSFCSMQTLLSPTPSTLVVSGSLSVPCVEHVPISMVRCHRPWPPLQVPSLNCPCPALLLWAKRPPGIGCLQAPPQEKISQWQFHRDETT